MEGGGSKGFGSGNLSTCVEAMAVPQQSVKGSGGRDKGFGSGGVGDKGTDPRDGANFATCVVLLLFRTRTKRRKMAFFEICPVGGRGVPLALCGGGGYPPELAWWTGGGSKGFGSGRVGGRGTGRSKSQRVSYFCCSNAYKKKKNGVF